MKMGREIFSKMNGRMVPGKGVEGGEGISAKLPRTWTLLHEEHYNVRWHFKIPNKAR